ncbi:hypothetical protein PQX77_009604 [Marasmius sp. AFHP31]|nr:hypothetical protein PQX77_009604 [Marasmius sp. AFHP31]
MHLIHNQGWAGTKNIVCYAAGYTHTFPESIFSSISPADVALDLAKFISPQELEGEKPFVYHYPTFLPEPDPDSNPWIRSASLFEHLRRRDDRGLESYLYLDRERRDIETFRNSHDIVAQCKELESWVYPFNTHRHDQQCGGRCPGDVDYVVRNLDKKEYSRREWRTKTESSRLKGRRKLEYDNVISWTRGLAMRLFLRLRWADNFGYLDDHEISDSARFPTKGAWVGDRIDMVPWEDREFSVCVWGGRLCGKRGGEMSRMDLGLNLTRCFGLWTGN